MFVLMLRIGYTKTRDHCALIDWLLCCLLCSGYDCHVVHWLFLTRLIDGRAIERDWRALLASIIIPLFCVAQRPRGCFISNSKTWFACDRIVSGGFPLLLCEQQVLSCRQEAGGSFPTNTFRPDRLRKHAGKLFLHGDPSENPRKRAIYGAINSVWHLWWTR